MVSPIYYYLPRDYYARTAGARASASITASGLRSDCRDCGGEGMCDHSQNVYATLCVCVHMNANRERGRQLIRMRGNTRSLSCGPVPVLLPLACLAVHVCVRFLALQVPHQPGDLGYCCVVARAGCCAARGPAGGSRVPPPSRLPALVCQEKDVTDFSRHGGQGAPPARE